MLKIIPIQKLYTSSNVRAQYDNEISELAKSIKEHGLLEPLVVQEKDNGRYEIVCGHRRYAALKLIDEPLIECNVMTLEENRTVLQLIENTQRREMLPWELTDAFDKLKTKYQLTNEQLAVKLGKTKSWIMNQYTKTKLMEKAYGDNIKDVTNKQVTKVYNAYTKASADKAVHTTEYKNGLKVTRLLKTEKRNLYKYELKFTSDEFKAKLEKFIEQETK